jgi:hypothetical protein
MARTARLTPRFLARRDALGVKSGSETSRALGGAIAALARASVLPGPLDQEAAIPPVLRALVRRVPRESLWIWYRFDDEIVTLVSLTDIPPVPTS